MPLRPWLLRRFPGPRRYARHAVSLAGFAPALWWKSYFTVPFNLWFSSQLRPPNRCGPGVRFTRLVPEKPLLVRDLD